MFISNNYSVDESLCSHSSFSKQKTTQVQRSGHYLRPGDESPSKTRFVKRHADGGKESPSSSFS
jgi:hypothetical protein